MQNTHNSSLPGFGRGVLGTPAGAPRAPLPNIAGGIKLSRVARIVPPFGTTLRLSIFHNILQIILPIYELRSIGVAKSGRAQRELCHGHPGHARARAGCPWHVERVAATRFWCRGLFHPPRYKSGNWTCPIWIGQPPAVCWSRRTHDTKSVSWLARKEIACAALIPRLAPWATIYRPCRACVKTRIGNEESITCGVRHLCKLLISGSRHEFPHRLCRA